MSTVRITCFELPGADGGPLRGEVRTVGRGECRPPVVICHGFKGFKDWGFFPHLATRLARAGMTAISFNFSGSGVGPNGESFSEPQRFGHSTFSNDLADIDTVCRALREGTLVDGHVPAETYGLFGHSRGGATAIIHAARNGEVAALVTWSAFSNAWRWDASTVSKWRAEGKLDIVNARTGEVLPLHTDVLDDLADQGETLDIVTASTRVKVPWLIVHGSSDESVSKLDAETLLHAAQPETTQLAVIEGGTHTFGATHPWAGYTPELETATDRTVSWFSRHLF